MGKGKEPRMESEKHWLDDGMRRGEEQKPKKSNSIYRECILTILQRMKCFKETSETRTQNRSLGLTIKKHWKMHFLF